MEHPPAAALLAWYDRGRRDLPWRGTSDAYRIWLSEVMLQQTTVAAVGPRFERFLARFPDVRALAAAPWEEVAAEWAGLGYYARARNLHAASRVIAERGFPADEAGWAALPGVGPYTAAAVAAIAHHAPVVPLDGNVERVVARLFAVPAPLPGAKPELRRLAQGFMAQADARARPGDFAQALFDLGAGICTPRRPACALCPWMEPCAARRQNIQEALPRKAPKPARGAIHGLHFLLTDRAGRVLLRRRPERGLLGGMLEIPGTPWRADPWQMTEAMAYAPLAGLDWRALAGEARHGFTHRDLTMRLMAARMDELPQGALALPMQAAAAALPTAMRRLLELAAAQDYLPAPQ
jgi:A/G-specific adenine glycosylase